MPKTKAAMPAADATAQVLSNDHDFFCEGNLSVIHCGAPCFLIDGVQLSELMRFHFKPRNTREGYQFGRVQIVVIPVGE